MIWDRWDDAMDDLDRDESAVLAEIERLESELRAHRLAVSARPGAGAADVRPYDGPQGAYEQRGAEVLALHAHRDALAGSLAAHRVRISRRRLMQAVAAIASVAILGAVLWRTLRDAPRRVGAQARGAAPVRLSLDLGIDAGAAGARDYERIIALVLALDRHPELDLVAGSALAFGTRVRRPDDAPPDAHGIASWRPGLAAWSPEFSLHRDDGQVLWRGRVDARPGEDDGALATRAARELARHLSDAGAAAVRR
jgi:hypothetical protein